MLGMRTGEADRDDRWQRGTEYERFFPKIFSRLPYLLSSPQLPNGIAVLETTSSSFGLFYVIF